MKLQIAAVGNRMPAWVTDGFAEYAKRMPPDLRIDLREIRPEPRGAGRTSAQAMSAEKERIEAVLPKSTVLVALDERGRDWSTMDLAHGLTRWQREGRDLSFVIGGADGLDPALKARADLLLRVSSLTLPHGMVRVLLVEQLYRAWSITQNHPYHRV